MKKERHEMAMHIVSGYSMIIFCQYCMDEAEFAEDGINSYSICRQRARRSGWTLHNDGYCTCKNCKI